MSELTPEQTELAILKTKADNLGVTYHHATGIEKLKALVKEAEETQLQEDDEEPEVTAYKETKEEEIARIYKDAKRLVRCNVTCMDPNLRDHNGLMLTVSNGIVGKISKYVEFNTSEGYHIPNIIYQYMLTAQCQVFVNVPDPRNPGKKKKEGKLIKKFAIHVLPDLTQAELDALAADQKARGAID